jgi:hypothetical protein
MMSVASQRAVPAMMISFQGTGRNYLEPGEVIMGDATVLSHCSLLRNSLPKPASVQ